jgi:flavin reductase (DIM6/NTAB) family NADH-FMN oxidoreductase RutF
MTATEQVADAIDLRRMLSQFATGVTVVTTSAAHDHECLTVNSFNSVSLSPPLILFSIHRASSGLEAFEQASRIGVNVLGDDHREVSSRFAGKGRRGWRACGVRPGPNGCLFVEGAIARMECTRWATYDGGDHRIFVCRVESFDYDERGRPLLFFRGNYHSIA